MSSVTPPSRQCGHSRRQLVSAVTASSARGPFSRLASGVVPKPRPAAGNLIEVDLEDDLVMVLQGGKLAYTLNTSTGGGYTYTDKTGTSVAITPKGVFHIFGVINGLDVDSLGTLWRPRFFTEGGIAIHGDSYVPPLSGFSRLCSREQRGDQLDMGEQHRTDRRRGMGFLRSLRWTGWRRLSGPVRSRWAARTASTDHLIGSGGPPRLATVRASPCDGW